MTYTTKKLTVILIFFQITAIAQTNLDQYKYLSVPDRFDFIKTPDQYQIGSLTRFLLAKKGFIILNFLENYPSDLALDNCLSLQVNIEKFKSFLQTKYRSNLSIVKKRLYSSPVLANLEQKIIKLLIMKP